ncbi:hypothetical protein PP175_10215 [Aneurinibacillus sp. Ricciae_BoGa-3]|uniref:CoA-transferase subunit beta n=1 Tax=Aneurinibacillus sp. Ricciae_BoGa-3 TaxID=3022697 RepID=UPI002342499D|nr:CoA-transferase [Aneurinibacillus sp. Ricciae_BoGa-3]WCK56253.1 hypothetical protein PP175_10215 [Aneurinibacillus sp. Ricciae_BoGa-3]
MQTEYTRDEMLTCSIAREIPPVGIAAQGIATPLVSAGYHLAKLTHAPELTISYTVGNTFSKELLPISLRNYETMTIGNALMKWSFMEAATQYLHHLKPWIEFFRPAQIDAYGNTNNVVIGNYKNPKIRLPGCAGIADVTNYLENIMFYIPRHNKKTLVEKVDFVSGFGWQRDGLSRKDMGLPEHGPKKIITELCVFEFVEGRAQLLSLHPYSSLDEVKENTGFSFELSNNFHITEPPSSEKLHLIRTKIDPLGIRKIEMLSGAARLSYLAEIIHKELRLL